MKRLSTCQQNMYIHVKKNNKKSWEVKIRNFPNQNQKKKVEIICIFEIEIEKKIIETTKVNKKERNKEREHFKVINL